MTIGRSWMCRVTLCVALISPFAADAHEFWIDPSEPRLAPGGVLQAELRVGAQLKGDAFPYLPDRFRSFLVLDGGATRPVRAAIGDLPAVRVPVGGPGLVRIVYHSLPSELRHEDFAKFADYAREEGLDDLVARHRRRGLPETGFVELFSRCAKALVAVGAGAGEDAPVGLPLEIVVESNPYRLGPADPVAVRLLWHGKALPGAQLSVFRRRPDGGLEVRRLRVDADGRAAVAAGAGFFLISAVHAVEPDPALAARTGAAWHSFWASATFTRDG